MQEVNFFQAHGSKTMTCYTRFDFESCDDAQIELLQAHCLPIRLFNELMRLNPSAIVQATSLWNFQKE